MARMEPPSLFAWLRNLGQAGEDPMRLVLLLATVALALWLLALALRAGRRRRLVDNTPTCKTTGVFIGLVEVKGTAESQAPLTSYLAERPCVLYRWCVEEHWHKTVTESYTDSKGNRQTRTVSKEGWTTVDQGQSMSAFYVKDDCGVLRVQPSHAQIECEQVFDQIAGKEDPLYYGKGPEGGIAHSTGRRRFTEYALPLHHPVYVMGQSRERSDAVAAEIAHQEDAPLFLISTRTERQISRGLNLQYWALGVLAMAAAAVGPLAAGAPKTQWMPLSLQALAVGLAAWVAGWVWMVYNSMVHLRQRLNQAWSNVDVQIKRRADLIPNLVKVVEGYRRHEADAQTQIALLRSQAQATRPGVDGPDPQACAPALLTIAERYPELSANQTFLNLQKSLTDTENRIALARGYFNQIAAHYNTRLAIVPDGWVTRLAGMRAQPLLAAEGFERQNAPIHLAS